MAERKTSTKKAAIPQGVADTFAARPDLTECYIYNDGSGWSWSKAGAEASGKEFTTVKRPK